MADFAITSQSIASTTALVRLSGDMTANSFALLEEEFNRVLDAGVAGMVLDLSGLDSLTSAGLGAIVNLTQLLDDRKGRAVVAAVRPKVLGLIEMLGLQEAVHLAESLDQAKRIVSSIKP